MINIKLSQNNYQYDIHSLVKAFYPKETINFKEVNNIDLWINYFDNKIEILYKNELNQITTKSVSNISNERKIYKNELKRLLYNVLSEKTNKTLPWGTLTGIRPTKLPMEKLELGISEKEIFQFMKNEYFCSDEKINLCIDIAKRELNILDKIDYKNGYSLYIGIPFCPSTCLYCSFTSYSAAKYKNYIEPYLMALFKEIEFVKNIYKDKKLQSIYIGGGTPTTLNEYQLEKLLDKITVSFNFENVLEFCVEAGRPDSITLEKLKILKKYNVTRISINPQSMNQKTLDIVGRKHTVDDVIAAFNLAKTAGHENINMDLIIGLLGETRKDVEFTLNQIEKLNPDSLTVHTLALKRAAGLNIEKEKYKELLSNDIKDMLYLTQDYAKNHNYLPYYLYRQKNIAENLENIGYSKVGKEGIYNILIMEEKQTILALGAGAMTKIVKNNIERVENVKSVTDYIERIDEMILRKKRSMIF